MSVTIQVLGRDRLAELRGPIHQLYRLCFAEPPWHESPEELDAHPEILDRDLAQPGIWAIAALDGPELAAIVYGWPSPRDMPDQPLYRAVTASLPASEHHHLLAPALKVTELMVHPRYRRRGLARTLLDRFVDGHPKAWLSTHPDAPARVLYESMGWRPLGTFTTGGGRPGAIYTRTVPAPEAPEEPSTGIELLDAGGLGELRDQVLDLYRQCFSEPPWNESPAMVEGYPRLLAEHLALPGLSGAVARAGSELTGVIYGWPSPATLPDEPFYRALAGGVPADDHYRLVSPALEVRELMVHPRSRGRGVGRALLDGFTRDRMAWLVTHPTAPAVRLYESAGWQRLGAFTNHRGEPRQVYTRTASAPEAPGTGSTARIAVPESSLL